MYTSHVTLVLTGGRMKMKLKSSTPYAYTVNRERSLFKTGRERKRKIGRAVEDLLRAPAYFAPLLRLIFKWTTSMCFFRVLALPNATPLQLPKALSGR